MSETADLGTELTLLSIDKIIMLRERIATAVALLEAGDSKRAAAVLEETLRETDVGKMKEWLPGEEPF